jgi:hypothetical protein
VEIIPLSSENSVLWITLWISVATGYRQPSSADINLTDVKIIGEVHATLHASAVVRDDGDGEPRRAPTAAGRGTPYPAAVVVRRLIERHGRDGRITDWMAHETCPSDDRWATRAPPVTGSDKDFLMAKHPTSEVESAMA